VLGIFEIGSLELFARGWLWTTILLISASHVARIIDMSHWHPTQITSYNLKIELFGLFGIDPSSISHLTCIRWLGQGIKTLNKADSVMIITPCFHFVFFGSSGVW
jgi:hypothetical protein